MKHRDGLQRCLVAHFKGDWREPEILPPCIMCRDCQQWIRPEQMDEECPSTRVPVEESC